MGPALALNDTKFKSSLKKKGTLEIVVPDLIARDHEVAEEAIRQEHLNLLVVGRHVSLKDFWHYSDSGRPMIL